ncbi:dienelactone hydrolase family protein [Microvirga aerilata]|uniref:Dienelactone hydrolase family protein n=1 Tax=Microvirga aerilata TaxID=670292 RepID=A0A936ZAD6_9HYPH|nr:dienelactone hydrolase family protein [Microvirga aerilata]MBL0406956.1 dienelactone hydrolase family protein [Microvirga aerilata]
MPQASPHAAITLQDVIRLPEGAAAERLQLVTTEGPITCRHHPAGGERAVLWVFGAGGGLGGPAGGLYTRLGALFRQESVTSLELDYRRPGYLQDCVVDVLVGLAYLESLGKSRIVLVGHSFGGAVVINAGAISEAVIAVAALSSQTAGTEPVGRLSPKPVIFIHGEQDEILPPSCSHDLHARAGEPKELVLYPGCLHGLDQCREALDRDMTRWLRAVLA